MQSYSNFLFHKVKCAKIARMRDEKQKSISENSYRYVLDKLDKPDKIRQPGTLRNLIHYII